MAGQLKNNFVCGFPYWYFAPIGLLDNLSLLILQDMKANGHSNFSKALDQTYAVTSCFSLISESFEINLAEILFVQKNLSVFCSYLIFKQRSCFYNSPCLKVGPSLSILPYNSETRHLTRNSIFLS